MSFVQTLAEATAYAMRSNQSVTWPFICIGTYGVHSVHEIVDQRTGHVIGLGTYEERARMNQAYWESADGQDDS